MLLSSLVLLLATTVAAPASGKAAPPPAAAAASTYDAKLAKRVGADERGMRKFVLVILKTGPTKVPEGEQRKAMFAGHFANMEKLASQGKLVAAGPFGKNDEGWRGLFLLAVETTEEARALTATDPVVVNGEMVAEFHPWYGSAAVMLLPELHKRVEPPAPAPAPAPAPKPAPPTTN